METLKIGPVRVSVDSRGKLSCEIPNSWSGDQYLRWKDDHNEELQALKKDGKRARAKG